MKSRMPNKGSSLSLVVSRKWCESKLTESFDKSLTYFAFEAVNE